MTITLFDLCLALVATAWFAVALVVLFWRFVDWFIHRP